MVPVQLSLWARGWGGGERRYAPAPAPLHEPVGAAGPLPLAEMAPPVTYDPEPLDPS